jgi:chemotaxis regulatin CheY-phosphate phosphatase CheZ
MANQLHTLSEDEFLEIEDALASTPRGRAFLRMRDLRQRVVASEEVRRLSVSIRDWVTRKVDGGGSASHLEILRRELHEMGAYIQRTRHELASLRMKDGEQSGSNRINLATEELDEIVRSTERATSDILNAAEAVLKLAGDVGGVAPDTSSELSAQATEILTACSFQDLTGQRITKVVNTLRYLEQRVNAMIEIWGVESARAVEEQMDKRPDAHLLNGPARAGHEKSQTEIDAILNGINGGEAGAKLPELLSGNDTAAPNCADKKAAARPANGAASQSDIDRLFN